jgi:putative ABC transport system permease protein
MPLLAGAILLLGSFVRLQRVDPGFDADHLLSMFVMLSPTTHPDRASRTRFWEPALERLEALPGVSRAALANERPPTDVNNVNNFQLEDRPTPPGEPERLAAWVVVGASYFEVMGIPLLEGRGFEPSDLDDEALPVILVDEAWARRNYPGESPVGRRLYSGGQTTGPRATIVGVVGTVPYEGIGASERGAMYQVVSNRFAEAWLLLRTAGDPHDVAPLVREELRGLDPTAPVVMMATGEELLRESLTRPRHLSLLLGLFSAVALGLAVVGIYGITSYSVQQGRADIAVRLALGGAPGSVLGRTLWEGMRVSLAGLAVGFAASLLLTGALSGLLYGVAPRDPAALAAAATVLLGVSAVACLLPALRAVRVDPASTLREE